MVESTYRASDGKCSQSGCTRTFRNHRHGRIDAHNAGWFFQKDGNIWCPDHHPEWVAGWRKKEKV